MAIYKGKCKVCGNGDEHSIGSDRGIDIYEDSDMCLTCTRLKVIEADIKRLEAQNGRD